MPDQTPLIDQGGNGRRGNGICCDSKRGTIVVNIVGIVLIAMSMIAWAVAYNDRDLEKSVTDPETVDRFNESYVPSMVVNGVGIVVNLIVIFGASIYSVWLVALGMAYVVVRLVFVMAVEVQIKHAVSQELHWIYYVWPVIWAAYMLYWHGLFILEVKRGIMSPHTYPQEKHSCCCGA